jgi:hypothetical protein
VVMCTLRWARSKVTVPPSAGVTPVPRWSH